MSRIALKDLSDGLEMRTDDATAYLDRDTGSVLFLGVETAYLSERDEPDQWADWEREMVEALREAGKGSKRYVQLPSKWDVHEWEIMRRFCGIVEDERLGQRLADAIRGRGAFRRFKDELDRNGLLDRWFDYKRSALREVAIAWCIENDIQFDQP